MKRDDVVLFETDTHVVIEEPDMRVGYDPDAGETFHFRGEELGDVVDIAETRSGDAVTLLEKPVVDEPESIFEDPSGPLVFDGFSFQSPPYSGPSAEQTAEEIEEILEDPHAALDAERPQPKSVDDTIDALRYATFTVDADDVDDEILEGVRRGRVEDYSIGFDPDEDVDWKSGGR